MKKTFIVLALLTLSVVAGAQTTYRIVYIPGTGEHQFGFNVVPSFVFGGQHLGVSVKDVGANDFKDADGMLTNALGVGAGIFYGYETVGNTVDWGNYTALYYGVIPFSGNVTFNRNGVSGAHNVSYMAQQIQLQFNPFLSYRINDQFSVSAGIGLDICPWLPSKVKVDGEALQPKEDSDVTIFKALLNSHLDANVGAKYWFSDELYVGLRVQYAFLNVLDLLGNTDEDTDELLSTVNGAVGIDLNNGTGTSTILPLNNIQAVLSVGFVW